MTSIKKKGFCHSQKPDQLRSAQVISIEDLQLKVDQYLFSYVLTGQQMPFANYIVQKLLQSQSDLNFVEHELVSIWNCIEQNKDQELLITVYGNFLNDIFMANHIAFFIQTHKVIDQVVNGDSSHDQVANLARIYVKVERVVDIVENIFKASAALSLFEGSQMLEVPFSQLQSIIQSLLMNVKIVYQQGQGQINAQDLQI